MDGGGPYRGLVQALHVLVRTAAAATAHDAEAAARTGAAVLQLVLAGENHFVLQERSGEVFANGKRLLPDAMGAHAVATLRLVFQRLQVNELLFTAAVGPEQLLQWARLCHKPPAEIAAELARRSLRGIEVGSRVPPAATGEPAPLPPADPEPPRAVPPPARPSLLRSVFVQHHLIGTLAADDPVPLTAAKTVLSGVADRLLEEPQGVEPLLHLQRDRALLTHSVQVCVCSAVLARWLGCPDQLVVEIAAAGLLHGLGAPLVAAQQPAPAAGADRAAAAGFAFLLGRGSSDFWIRCALVARLLPEVRGCELGEAVAETSLPAVIVRVADRFDELRQDGTVSGALAELEREARQGCLPGDATGALREALHSFAPA